MRKTKTFEVLWKAEFDGFNRTKVESKSKPLYQEAAQVVAVKEDIEVTDVDVSSVREDT